MFLRKHALDTLAVMLEIAQERVKQDQLWGGPIHDDKHNVYDWAEFILKQLKGLVMVEHGGLTSNFREQMVKIAALAVAAIQWHDRHKKGLSTTDIEEVLDND